jgi:RNA polymerase sigma factor (TIGR02999 family)
MRQRLDGSVTPCGEAGDGDRPDAGRLTEVLARWSAGDAAAGEAVVPVVYRELRRIAQRQFRRERQEHTLQPTAVVHEAFLRLRDARGLRGVQWNDREQFYAFAAHLMRRVLVDHARERGRLKRGGGARLLSLEAAEAVADATAAPRDPDVLELDEALTTLARRDPRKAAIVELRVFGGLGARDIARHLGVSEETVGREWRRAKAWLRTRLEAEPRASLDHLDH